MPPHTRARSTDEYGLIIATWQPDAPVSLAGTRDERAVQAVHLPIEVLDEVVGREPGEHEPTSAPTSTTMSHGWGLTVPPAGMIPRPGVRREVAAVESAHDRLRYLHDLHAVGRRAVRTVDRPDARRLHQDPEQVGDVRSRVAAARPHGSRRRAVRRLGEGAPPRGRAARGGAPRRAHAGHLHRHPGHGRPRRRHGHAVRPPRQAAGDDRLARGPRAVDAGDRGRQAVRPRRRRRRLRDLRVADRDQRAPARQHPARALRRADRGVRGVRQLRPAGVHRSPGAADRRAVARGVPRLGLRELRAAVVDHVAARARDRQPRRLAAHRGRALRRRHRRDRRERARDPHPPRSDRRLPHRDVQAPRALDRDPAAARAAGGAHRRGDRRGRVPEVPAAARRRSRCRTTPRS